MTKLSVVVAVAVVVAVPTMATGSAVALTANGRYYCGSSCNGKPADSKVPGQSFTCADDRRIQATGIPTKKMMGVPGFDDPSLKITVYYSHRCQTMWARVTNTKAIGRTWMIVQLNSSLSSYFKNYPTPAAGASVTTAMIDDHSPSYGIAASVDVEEAVRGVYSRYYFSY